MSDTKDDEGVKGGGSERIRDLEAEIRKAHAKIERMERGFSGSEEQITIKPGGVVRHVTCLACNTEGEITNEEAIQAPAGEIGEAIIEALNECQDASEWKNGCCAEHAHLGDKWDHEERRADDDNGF